MLASSGDFEAEPCVWVLQSRSQLHSYPQQSFTLPKSLARGRRAGKEPLNSCTPKEALAELDRWGQAVEHLLLPTWRDSSRLLSWACAAGERHRVG